MKVAFYFNDYKELNEIAAYGDDDPEKIGTSIDGLPVFDQNEILNFTKRNEINTAITAIGNNQVRGEKYNL